MEKLTFELSLNKRARVKSNFVELTRCQGLNRALCLISPNDKIYFIFASCENKLIYVGRKITITIFRWCLISLTVPDNFHSVKKSKKSKMSKIKNSSQNSNGSEVSLFQVQIFKFD